jgi:hypothetical protein
MLVKQYKKISFGAGVDPTGKNQFIWVGSGKEMDAMVFLFDKGWTEANFVFENCEVIE